MTDALLISDLHLSDARPEAVALFLRFLRQRGRETPNLYILGDLFDAWIGDDDDGPMATQVRKGLRTLTDGGTRLFLQRGNRDFLMGRRFARETGGALLDHYVVHELGGVPTLLTHGDLLCSDDIRYQKARRRMFNPLFRAFLRLHSLPRRRRMAADYRAKSNRHKANLPESIMDANADTVIDVMEKHQVRRLVHGHTHRPALHQVPLQAGTGERYVLDQWFDDRGDALRVTATGVERLRITSTA